MQYDAATPEEYIEKLPEERKEVFSRLRETINENLPEGFEEVMSYGMIGYVVPHTSYPAGYHVDPKTPLPFINIASQKNFIALYHMGIYANAELLNWFEKEYPKHSTTKLDMGKSCIRLKNIKNLPYALIGELVSKMTVDEWIQVYEESITKK
ncbi:DUF1801 domain-containing protein [Bacteroidota bacterium]